MKKHKLITVAIDSPAAAGAGTQAKMIAKNYMQDVLKPDTLKGEEKLAEDQAKKNEQDSLEAFGKVPGQNLESAQMSAWGLLTSVAYTADRLGKTPDSRLRQSWFGPSAKIKKRALELALTLIE